MSPALAGRFFTTSVNWEVYKSTIIHLQKKKKNPKVIIFQLKENIGTLKKKKKIQLLPSSKHSNALRIKA